MSALSEFLLELVDHQLQKVELGFVAEIVSFDKTNMRAEIKPLLRSITEDDGKDSPKFLDLPNLDDVPVELIFAGGFFIRPVYAPGDLVKCSCTASNIEEPIEDRQRSNMLDKRFSLSYVTVTGSIVPSNFEAPATWASKDGALIGNGDAVVLEITDIGFEFTGPVTMIGPLTASGGLVVTGGLSASGDIEVDGNIEATGDVTATGDVKAGPISLLTHTHAVTALAAPTGPPLP